MAKEVKVLSENGGYVKVTKNSNDMNLEVGFGEDGYVIILTPAEVRELQSSIHFVGGDRGD